MEDGGEGWGLNELRLRHARLGGGAQEFQGIGYGCQGGIEGFERLDDLDIKLFSSLPELS